MTSTNISNPYAVKQAYKPFKGGASYSFPNELDQSPVFLSMNIRSYQDTPGFTSPTAKLVSGYNIHLPVPYSGLEDSFHIQYQETPNGRVGGLVQGIAQAIQDPSTIAGNAKAGLISSLMGGLTVGAESFSAAVGQIAHGQAEPHVGIGQAIQASFGKAINPNISVLFNGVGIRTHTFRWKLMARSQEDSTKIYAITKLLKAAALPSRLDGNVVTLDYPDVAFLSLNGPQGNGLITFAGWGAFIENVSVSYNGASHPAFFVGQNSPVEIDLMISFRERSIVTSEDIPT